MSSLALGVDEAAPPPLLSLEDVGERLGQEPAVALFRQAEALEEAGDFMGSQKAYGQAFRRWPALDSGFDDEGVLPAAVRAEAEAAGVELGRAAATVTDDVPRFKVEDSERWLAFLDEHGFCVLASVADEAAVARGRVLMWDFLEGVPGTRVRRGDAGTWGDPQDWLPSAGNGIVAGHGFAHSAFAWHARLLPKVRQAFAAVWGGDEDLLVSFDAGNVFRPWALNPAWKTGGSWWHVDQNACLPNTPRCGRVCVQGFVTFTDATPATGGLCVVPRSHPHHREVCERGCGPKIPGDFVPVSPGDPVLRLGSRLVCARAGDLVLWDSRCVHCNTPGVEPSSDATGVEAGEATGAEADAGAAAPSEDAGAAELLRVAGYVCMTPNSWASDEVRRRRQDAYVRNVGTNHWPHEFHPSEEKHALPPNSWDDLSDTQRALIVGAVQGHGQKPDADKSAG